MNCTKHFCRMPDGVQLHVRLFEPAGTSASRTLLFIHGGCEHGGRYDHIAQVWTERGWRVVIPDHRGHGESEGVRTDIADHTVYLRDLREILSRFGPANLWMAHSMGGLLAARLAQTSPPPQGLILCSPLFGLSVPVPIWKRLIGWVLSWIAPTTRFRTRLNPKNMTTDAVFLERRRNDPLMQKSITARWFFALQRGLVAVNRDAAQIRCPLLIFQGLSDLTVDPAAVRAWFEQTSSRDKQLIEYPDRVHELLNDPGWPDVTAPMLAWADRVVPR